MCSDWTDPTTSARPSAWPGLASPPCKSAACAVIGLISQLLHVHRLGQVWRHRPDGQLQGFGPIPHLLLLVHRLGQIWPDLARFGVTAQQMCRSTTKGLAQDRDWTDANTCRLDTQLSRRSSFNLLPGIISAFFLQLSHSQAISIAGLRLVETPSCDCESSRLVPLISEKSPHVRHNPPS